MPQGTFNGVSEKYFEGVSRVSYGRLNGVFREFKEVLQRSLRGVSKKL